MGDGSTLLRLLEAGERHRASFVARTPLRIRRRTFAQTLALSERIAAELHRRGLVPGDRLLLWGQSGPEWVAAFLGALRRGVVLVPLDVSSAPELAATVQAEVAASLAMVSREVVGAARGAWPDLAVLVLEDLEVVLPRGGPAPEDVVAAPTDPVEIVFTSGTTSRPKGVVLSHRNLTANLAPLEAVHGRWESRLRLVRRRPVVTVLPLSHVFGQTVGLLVPLATGITPVFVTSPTPRDVATALRAEGAYALMTVPRVLAGLRREVEDELARRERLAPLRARRERARGAGWLRRAFAARSFRSVLGWRFVAVVVGGAALDPREERAWRDMGYLVAQGYGLTETAPIVSVASPLRGREGWVGRPLPGQDVRLAADGELLVRGGNVTEGYLEHGRLRPATDEEGWFHTGDLAEMDAEGRLRIRGRTKDVIVTAEGVNVYPRDVEEALSVQRGVREAAVVGRAGEQGETVHAWLLLEPSVGDPEPVAVEAVRAANERLLPRQRIRSHAVWPHDDFPRTESTGKVIKRRLAEEAARREAPRPDPDAAVAAVLGAGADRAASLSDLGLSSLDAMELVDRLEREHGITVDEAALGREVTVERLRELARAGEGAGRRPSMPAWARWRPSRLLGLVLRGLLAGPVLAVACRVCVRGRAGLRALRGPVLLVGNHSSTLDAPVVFRAVPLRLSLKLMTAMATEPFEPLFSGGGTTLQRAWQRSRYVLAVLAFGAFPLPRAAGFRPSLQHAGRLVDEGFSVLVFPEGRMSDDGTLGPFRGGAGLLARELAVPVVPFWLEGLHAVLPPGRRWPRHGPVTVTFGPPVRLPEAGTPEEVAAALERAVRNLAPGTGRGPSGAGPAQEA